MPPKTAVTLRRVAARARTPAWKTKPSRYIVDKNDRAVPPDLERFVSKRMGAHTIGNVVRVVCALRDRERALTIGRQGGHPRPRARPCPMLCYRRRGRNSGRRSRVFHNRWLQF